MNYFGLVPRYRINRQLSQEELKHRLAQNKRLDIDPLYQLCVIKMNSTFLESVDKWYGWRGSLSLVALAGIAMSLVTMGVVTTAAISDSNGWQLQEYDVEILLSAATCMLPMLFVGVWLLTKDWFSLTHYPIRFDRKKRMVYAFHTDGTVSSTPWDEVYFTLCNVRQLHEWEVCGHILEPGTLTVKKTFSLSYTGPLNPSDICPGLSGPSKSDFVRAHWEFIRRYMEDGPEAISGQVQFCLPLDGRREGVRVGAERIFANFASLPAFIYLLVWPFCALVSVLRIFAMRTSKVPVWPENVEADCEIEEGDPYAITGNENAERVAVYPEAAVAAGIDFRPRVDVAGKLRLSTEVAKVNK